MSMRSVGLWTLFALLLGGCPKTPKSSPEAAPAAPLPCVVIPGAPLCWKLPAGWTVADPNAAQAIAEPPSASGAAAAAREDAGAGEDAGRPLDDTTLLASGRRSDPAVASRHPPRVEVYVNHGLPPGYSAADYLAANRLAQRQTLGDIQVRHLEVEPVRRSGRAGFHVRDAFDVPLAVGGEAPVSQHALLLLDGTTGYVIVVTLLEDELSRYHDELRDLLGSVVFVAAGR